MSIVVNTNISSIQAQTHLSRNTMKLNKSYEKLASGYRINRSADDAAGMGLSEILRAQIRGQEQAYNNVQDGVNVLNTADDALQGTSDNLQRIRELAVQAASDTLSSSQRSSISVEVTQLMSEINRVSSQTEFNGKALLDGSLESGSFKLQIGANADETLTLNGTGVFATATTSSLGISGLDVSTTTAATSAIDLVDAAISELDVQRAKIGAYTNRLDSISSNLETSITNYTASESRIRNVDVAQESAKMTQYQILQSTASTILGYANLTPQIALSLIKGLG